MPFNCRRREHWRLAELATMLGVDVVTEHRHPAQTPDMGRHALSSQRSSKGPPKGQEPNARSETEIGETDDGVSAISARSRQERNTN